MILMKEYKQGLTSFSSLIHYFGFVSDGIMLNKDGSLSSSLYYSGPDMDSSLDEELSLLANHVNYAFAKLGSGWTIHIDAIRMPSVSYPAVNEFTHPTLLLIENYRRKKYEAEGFHFESAFAMTLTFRPSWAEHKQKLEQILEYYQKMLKEFYDALSGRLSVKFMGSQDMFDYLGYCLTGKKIHRRVPEPAVYLAHSLGAYDFVGGMSPKIDDMWIYTVALIGFPSSTYTGILDLINRLPFEYRFNCRFIMMDQLDAEAQLKKVRRNFYNKHFDVSQIANQLLFNEQSSHYVNNDALSSADDADLAITEAQSGKVKYGYFTAVTVIFDKDRGEGRKKAEQVRKILDNNGFPSRIEEANAVEAYLGSLPGQEYPNVRKPLINTLNLSHLVSLTSIWAGLEHNPNHYYPEKSAPLFFSATSGFTPFRFNIHVSDVGHTLVIGPTGSGKSTLLSLMAASFFRYKNAQVFLFDKGFSQYALVKACGGDHYNIFNDGKELTFCPLAGINQENELVWALTWVEEILRLQGLDIDPRIRNDIADGLRSLVHDQKRTISNLYTNIQNSSVKEALRPFVMIFDGIMGGLLDAEVDGLRNNAFQVFEMENLLNKDEKYVVPVLTYLFHRIDGRLNGRPTLIILDEAWLVLKHEIFREKFESWLRELRKKNAAVVFATNSISDVINSPLRNVIDESCPTKIFLPNATASNPANRSVYHAYGLNDKQIDMIQQAIPKKHYYYTSVLGQRLIDLGLDGLELSFMGINSAEDLKAIRKLEQMHGADWVAHWLKIRGMENND
ncbi:MAG: conjugal transfer protein TrbE [Candidatus Omnitrophica bacterium]|nr:conjugal transfer protein TrbE [Candidatus Omnitrophota bacterium]